MKKYLIALILTIASTNSFAEGWCTLSPGNYSVITDGIRTNRAWLVGKFDGLTTSLWLPIQADGVGSTNVSIVLAGQVAGESVQVYLDGASDTCATAVSYQTVVRHVRIVP